MSWFVLLLFSLTLSVNIISASIIEVGVVDQLAKMFHLNLKKVSLYRVLRIERSKNKHEVRYAAVLNPKTCHFALEEPVLAYWRSLATDPFLVEPLSWLDKRAYAVSRLKRISNNSVQLIIRGLPDTLIEIVATRAKRECRIQAFFTNAKEGPALLDKVYIYSEETDSLVPKVKYVDFFLRKDKNSRLYKERLTPQWCISLCELLHTHRPLPYINVIFVNLCPIKMSLNTRNFLQISLWYPH